jgi:hypothetical protein
MPEGKRARCYSIITLTDVILLMGPLTKNAILLVNYTNALRRHGKNRREALLAAGPWRSARCKRSDGTHRTSSPGSLNILDPPMSRKATSETSLLRTGSSTPGS